MDAINKQTGLESLLGKHYKWWYFGGYYFRLRTTYLVDNFLFALGNVFTLLGTILTWFVASGANFDPAFQSQLTYYIIGTFYYSFITVWPSYYGYEIKKGSHSSLLLAPIGFFQYQYVRYAAIASFQNLNTIGIILLTSPLWFRYIERPESILNVILLVLLIPISASIMYFLDTIIGLMAFFITEINGLTLNYRFISSTLSGRLFPLGLLIPLFWINAANPFGYLFYHPMQLYFGNYNAAEVAGIFIVGILWAVALYGTTQALFKFGLRRNESVGL